ncbi:hypothetical protein SK128_003713 [Halocaridina rubra]|uniref:Uncharacterized protein n=1 Tax=Halocaridina rubra TaxID=373956 RepID=A0AAN9ACA7_HALRR
MNWVGGIRKRVMLREEERHRQDRFFAAHAAAKQHISAQRTAPSLSTIGQPSMKFPRKVGSHKRRNEELIYERITSGSAPGNMNSHMKIPSTCFQPNSALAEKSGDALHPRGETSRSQIVIRKNGRKYFIKRSSLHGPFSWYMLQLEAKGVQHKIDLEERKRRLRRKKQIAKVKCENNRSKTIQQKAQTIVKSNNRVKYIEVKENRIITNHPEHSGEFTLEESGDEEERIPNMGLDTSSTYSFLCNKGSELHRGKDEVSTNSRKLQNIKLESINLNGSTSSNSSTQEEDCLEIVKDELENIKTSEENDNTDMNCTLEFSLKDESREKLHIMLSDLENGEEMEHKVDADQKDKERNGRKVTPKKRNGTKVEANSSKEHQSIFEKQRETLLQEENVDLEKKKRLMEEERFKSKTKEDENRIYVSESETKDEKTKKIKCEDVAVPWMKCRSKPSSSQSYTERFSVVNAKKIVQEVDHNVSSRKRKVNVEEVESKRDNHSSNKKEKKCVVDAESGHAYTKNKSNKGKEKQKTKSMAKTFNSSLLKGAPQMRKILTLSPHRLNSGRRIWEPLALSYHNTPYKGDSEKEAKSKSLDSEEGTKNVSKSNVNQEFPLSKVAKAKLNWEQNRLASLLGTRCQNASSKFLKQTHVHTSNASLSGTQLIGIKYQTYKDSQMNNEYQQCSSRAEHKTLHNNSIYEHSLHDNLSEKSSGYQPSYAGVGILGTQAKNIESLLLSNTALRSHSDTVPAMSSSSLCQQEKLFKTPVASIVFTPACDVSHYGSTHSSVDYKCSPDRAEKLQILPTKKLGKRKLYSKYQNDYECIVSNVIDEIKNEMRKPTVSEMVRNVVSIERSNTINKTGIDKTPYMEKNVYGKCSSPNPSGGSSNKSSRTPSDTCHEISVDEIYNEIFEGLNASLSVQQEVVLQNQDISEEGTKILDSLNGRHRENVDILCNTKNECRQSPYHKDIAKLSSYPVYSQTALDKKQDHEHVLDKACNNCNPQAPPYFVALPEKNSIIDCRISAQNGGTDYDIVHKHKLTLPVFGPNDNTMQNYRDSSDIEATELDGKMKCSAITQDVYVENTLGEKNILGDFVNVHNGEHMIVKGNISLANIFPVSSSETVFIQNLPELDLSNQKKLMSVKEANKRDIQNTQACLQVDHTSQDYCVLEENRMFDINSDTTSRHEIIYKANTKYMKQVEENQNTLRMYSDSTEPQKRSCIEDYNLGSVLNNSSNIKDERNTTSGCTVQPTSGDNSCSENSYVSISHSVNSCAKDMYVLSTLSGTGEQSQSGNTYNSFGNAPVMLGNVHHISTDLDRKDQALGSTSELLPEKSHVWKESTENKNMIYNKDAVCDLKYIFSTNVEIGHDSKVRGLYSERNQKFCSSECDQGSCMAKSNKKPQTLQDRKLYTGENFSYKLSQNDTIPNIENSKLKRHLVITVFSDLESTPL